MLRITGKKLNKEEKEILKECAKFTLDKFVTKSKQKRISVIVEIGEEKLNGWSGQCEYLGRENNIRKFRVYISSKKVNKNAKDVIKKMRDPLLTIIHELVHVKQYVNCQLFDYKDGKTKFEGKVYENCKQYEKYWDMPWEIEAYGRTEGVWDQFVTTQRKLRKLRKKK
jgi:hypothetical protein